LKFIFISHLNWALGQGKPNEDVLEASMRLTCQMHDPVKISDTEI
jgi:hypothetical protein